MAEPKQTHAGRPPLPDSERADSHIHLRIRRAKKARYVRAANRKQQTLAAWAIDAMDDSEKRC